MKNTIFVQNGEENNMLKKLSKEFKKAHKKVYCMFSNLKESGYDLLEPELLKSKKTSIVVLGIDKRNTTKLLLERIMQACKEVYLYNNNKDKVIDSNICIFEDETSSLVYIFSGNISEGGLLEDYNMCIMQEYDLTKKTDIAEYQKVNDVYNTYFELAKPLELNRENIELLSSNKEIFTTKIYEHKPMSINELLNRTKGDTKVESLAEEYIDDDAKPKTKELDIDKILSNDFDFEIDTDLGETKSKSVKKTSKKEKEIEVEKVKDKPSEKVISKLEEISEEEMIPKEEEESTSFDISNEVLDIESMVFKKSKAGISRQEIREEKKNIDKISKAKEDEKIKKDEKPKKIVKPKIVEEPIKEEDTVVSTKKVDLNKVTNLVMQMNKVEPDDKDLVIKIPTYVRKVIPKFFGWTEEFKKASDKLKTKEISIEVVDIATNKKKQLSAEFSQLTGQTYMELVIKEAKDFNISADDIVRLVKQTSDNYSLEIVSRQLMEYEIWLKFCTFSFKGNERKYGIM